MEFESLFRDNAEEWNGLTVYPVRMRDYPAFLTARGCITAAQQSWPYPWSTVKYLDGLVGMGMLPQLAVMLQTVLRLEEDPLPVFPKMKGDKLDALLVLQGKVQAEITSNNFGALRELIARQNGLELPDETANLELLEAEKDAGTAGGIRLKPSLEDLIYSVALKAGAAPEEIMGWTVRRFQTAERAADRSAGHLIAAVTLAAGGKFKGGNPYPSWKYDREKQTCAVEPLSTLSGRLSGSVDKK